MFLQFTVYLIKAFVKRPDFLDFIYLGILFANIFTVYRISACRFLVWYQDLLEICLS